MPKKSSSWGVNTKSVEANERKAEKKKNELEAKQRATEDAKWADNDKLLERKQLKKETEAQKKQEALAKKLEAKKLLEEEEAKLSSKSAKVATVPQKKVTRSDIEKQKEKEKKQNEDMLKELKLQKKRIGKNPEMEPENPNRKMAQMLEEEDIIEARNIDEAVAALKLGNDGSVDNHPEKRLKAAYNEYAEREMPRIKEENPGLRMSQWKQVLWKEWQKSEDNPLNQR
ncbi:coiled-coil domain-containing protein 124 isoform X2 [Hydra vulgaris]|uniref:Coiled-coil domain-containing protein 124 isoform X2 n=1 Tax=Hydra vulgaris TaxID=6087 RepID=A0ABM4DDC4_HYDVU